MNSSNKSNDKNQIVVITGMTGVGKDFLVGAANAKHQLNAIGWGEMLGRELAADRDLMMRAVDPKIIRAGQFAVCRKVLAMQPLVAICHVVKPENGKYIYNLEIEKQLNPLCYVFVAAPAELIDQRVRERNKTGGRKSPEIPIREIEEVQKIKLDLVRKLAKIQNAELIILNNIDEELEANIHRLDQLITVLKTKGA